MFVHDQNLQNSHWFKEGDIVAPPWFKKYARRWVKLVFANYLITVYYPLGNNVKAALISSPPTRVSVRPERQTVLASWQFRRLAFSRSKRYQACAAAPHFHARLGARPGARDYFHFATAHTCIQFWVSSPPPPPPPGVMGLSSMSHVFD